MKSDRIKNWPKDERPRERLLKEDIISLTAHANEQGIC